MADSTSATSFANRDNIPILSFDPTEDLSDEHSTSPSGTPTRKRDRLKQHASNIKGNFKKAQGKAAETGSSVQDRLLEKLLSQVIPTEDLPSNQPSATSPNTTIRPSFSLPTMSTNFRRFNARIGVVFVFQARVIRLLSWRNPIHTLSLLAIYTFICLDPYLLSVLPFITILLALLIPAFIARHPAAPNTLSSTSTSYSTQPYTASGPPLAPPVSIKPVKELSKDFFRNMRDLQNSMEDFSHLHDQLLTLFTPPTNFSNEPLSSTIFHICILLASVLFLSSHLLPWKLIFLITGWAVIILGHPALQRPLANTTEKHLIPRTVEAKSSLDAWIARDIILDSAPETREVEIFELQRLSPGSGEWEPWVFTRTPYDPLSRERLVGDRVLGTRFFEDVRPPDGWEWSGKKWALDLWAREWVEDRIITGVEVETEGERWVYDIRYQGGDNEDESASVMGRGRGDSRLKVKPLPTWEEGSDAEAEGRGRRGQWRRRRWVRMVKRKWQPGKGESGNARRGGAS